MIRKKFPIGRKVIEFYFEINMVEGKFNWGHYILDSYLLVKQS